jgi:hypothetical protein
MDDRVGAYASMLADNIDVGHRIIFRRWSPSENQFPDRVAWATAQRSTIDRAPDQLQGCTDAILHRYELLKGGIGLIRPLSHPVVTFDDVQRVVVPDTSHLFHLGTI